MFIVEVFEEGRVCAVCYPSVQDLADEDAAPFLRRPGEWKEVCRVTLARVPPRPQFHYSSDYGRNIDPAQISLPSSTSTATTRSSLPVSHPWLNTEQPLNVKEASRKKRIKSRLRYGLLQVNGRLEPGKERQVNSAADPTLHDRRLRHARSYRRPACTGR